MTNDWYDYYVCPSSLVAMVVMASVAESWDNTGDVACGYRRRRRRRRRSSPLSLSLSLSLTMPWSLPTSS